MPHPTPAKLTAATVSDETPTNTAALAIPAPKRSAVQPAKLDERAIAAVSPATATSPTRTSTRGRGRVSVHATAPAR
jgi:hypothetical protein